MNLGKLGLDEEITSSARSAGSIKKHLKGTAKVESDIARLLLLVFMLMAAVAGNYYKKFSNQPMYILRKSINKTLKQPFRASIEGSSSLKDSTLCIYRNRQRYTPENGVTLLSDAGSGTPLPFDAAEALGFLRYSQNPREYNRQDMYGYATRHFSGSFKLAGDDDSVAYVFEYWISTSPI